MALLYFSDILKKANLDPKKVVLIRHSLTDKHFRECYEADKVYEYTCHQKPGFRKGYTHWAVFISGAGTYAKFHAIYEVGGSRPDNEVLIPEGLPKIEAASYNGQYEIYDLKRLDVLKDMEKKLTIDWGKSTRSWHQTATNEKAVISIALDEKKVFSGFENLVMTFDELKDIVDNPEIYDSWHTALKSVHAVYLITDTTDGKQYVGSASGTDGLLGRWTEYIKTHHGGNNKMIELLKDYTERYHEFQFSILQILPKTLTSDDVVSEESLWKKKLLSIEFGLNDNYRETVELYKTGYKNKRLLRL